MIRSAALLLALLLLAGSGKAATPPSAELLIEAEDYDEKSGQVAPETKGSVVCLGFIQTGNWVKYSDVDFGFAMTHFNAQVASRTDTSFGSIAVYVDSLDTTAVAVLEGTVTGGWSDFGTVSVPMSATVSGVHDLYLQFEYGYNVDWVMFNTTSNPTQAPPPPTLAPPTVAPPTVAPPTLAPPTVAPPTVALDDAFPFCSYTTSIVDGWIEDPKDVRSYLQYLRGPSSSKPSVFLERDDTSRAQHAALFAALDREDYWTVQQVAPTVNYDIVCQLRQMRGGAVDKLLLFSGVYDAKDQQIHLLWRTGVTDPVIIESGHTQKDQAGGGNVAIDTPCFVMSNARMLLRNSIAARRASEDSPCSGDYKVSDGPHYDKGWFHMAHEEYLALHPSDAVIQFHGMSSSKSDGKTVYVHISPGFKNVVKEDSLLRYIDNGLVATFDTDYVEDYMASSARSSDWTNLRVEDYHPATFNVQGRHVNRSPDPCKTTATASHYNSAIQQFVHLELSSNPRNNHIETLTNTINYAGAHWKARNGGLVIVEAEAYDSKAGNVRNETKPNGVACLGYISTGDWVRYSNVDFGDGKAVFKAHVSTGSATSSGTITVRVGSIDSPAVAVLSESVAGGWSNFGVKYVQMSETVSGVQDVFLEFGSGYNLDWFAFDK